MGLACIAGASLGRREIVQRSRMLRSSLRARATWLRTTARGGPPLRGVHRRIVRSLDTGRIIDDCVVDDIRDDVLNRKLHKPEDVRVELIMKDAVQMYLTNGPDTVEIFSQPRVSQEAALRSYDGVRLIPGWGLDLSREGHKLKAML